MLILQNRVQDLYKKILEQDAGYWQMPSLLPLVFNLFAGLEHRESIQVAQHLFTYLQ